MAFKIIVSPSAQLEIFEVMNYYAEVSDSLPLKFYTDLQNVYDALILNPNYRILYKNFRLFH